jgi:hypothetical protein
MERPMRLRTVLSAAVLVAATATFSQSVEMNAITKVEVQESAGTTVVSITGSRPPNFTTFPMMDPPRFVIDFSEARLKGVSEGVSGAGMVQQATCLSYGSDASAIVRVMLTFKDEVDPPDVQTVGNTLVVKVNRPGAPLVAQAAAPPQAGQAVGSGQAAGAQAAASEKAKAEAAAAAAAEQARVESERAQALAAAKAKAEARAEAEAQARAKAEAEAQARAQAAAAEQARAEAAARARADAEAAAAAQTAHQAKARAEAEAVAAAAAAEQAKAEAAAKARADAEAAAAAQAAAKARADAEEATAAQAAAKARSDAEAAAAAQAAQAARAKAEAEATAAAAAAARARAEAAAKAGADAEAEAAAQAAARARADAEAAERAAERARSRETAPAVATVAPPARPEPRPAVAAGARGPARRNQVREIGFKQSTDGSRVFVRTAAEPRFVIREAGPRTIRVEFPNTQVLRRNDTRFLDTSFFPSAVAMVSPRREGAAYVVEITLKQMVPYQQKLEGDMLAIDFERPAGLRSGDGPVPAAGERAAPTPARPAGN